MPVRTGWEDIMVKTTEAYIAGASARFQADNASDDTVALRKAQKRASAYVRRVGVRDGWLDSEVERLRQQVKA